MCNPLSSFNTIQLTQKEKEVGTYKQNQTYERTKSDRFIIQVARQSGVLTQDTSVKASLSEIKKKKNRTRSISIVDMNMDAEKFKILNVYFPRIFAIKVENTRLNNTLICTAAKVQQYFPRRNLTVLGIKANRDEFFDLITYAPKK